MGDFYEHTTEVLPTGGERGPMSRMGYQTIKTETESPMVAVASFGILSNAFAVLVICRYKRMRTRQSMILIVNQCLVDLAASVFVGAYHAVSIAYGKGVSPYDGLAGQVFCRLYYVVPHWGLIISSSYNLLAITTERYLMIVYPIYHKTNITKAKLYLTIGFVWAIGPTYRLVFGAPTSQLTTKLRCATYRNWLSDGWETFHTWLSPFFQFYVPALVMSCMYIRMIKALSRKVQPQLGVPQGSKNNISRSQRNLIKTLVTVLACFIACWVTRTTYLFLFRIGVIDHINLDVRHYSIVLVYVNCCINPFIYLLKYSEFRAGVRFLIGCGPGQVEDGGPSSSNSGGSRVRSTKVVTLSAENRD